MMKIQIAKILVLLSSLFFSCNTKDITEASDLNSDSIVFVESDDKEEFLIEMKSNSFKSIDLFNLKGVDSLVSESYPSITFVERSDTIIKFTVNLSERNSFEKQISFDNGNWIEKAKRKDDVFNIFTVLKYEKDELSILKRLEDVNNANVFDNKITILKTGGLKTYCLFEGIEVKDFKSLSFEDKRVFSEKISSFELKGSEFIIRSSVKEKSEIDDNKFTQRINNFLKLDNINDCIFWYIYVGIKEEGFTESLIY